jgi:flagellar hook-basal body complex protein FliE
MSRRVRLSWLSAALTAIVVLAACGAPPDKELHQAQGAIDAARAAGAEQYAAEEYKAAVDALDRAKAAVADRDYRLALNNALDSLEQAQNAAKAAADQKAAARSDAERLLAEVMSAIAVTSARLQAADVLHTSRAATEPLRAGLAAARQATDDAGKALAIQDYLAARARLQGVGPALSVLLQQLPAPPRTSPARPPRRRK